MTYPCCKHCVAPCPKAGHTRPCRDCRREATAIDGVNGALFWGRRAMEERRG